MCGRYYIEISDAALKELIEEIMQKMSTQPDFEQLQIKFDGEIFPTNTVIAQTAPDQYAAMRWGFSGFSAARRTAGSKAGAGTTQTATRASRGSARPIINARSETILEKPAFRQSVLERRCLIPASGYYEWKSEGSQKVKYQIFAPGQMVYLAACYRQEQEADKQISLPRFVILTQAAAPQLASIHDRMPVLFTVGSANRWLEEGPAALEQSYQDLSYQVA